MSTLAYTLLAAAGGGSGSTFYVGFINSNGNYPRPLSTFSSAATLVSNDDGDIIVGGRGAMDSSQFQGTMLYNIKNSDLSIENLQASTWGTGTMGASANEQTYTIGGGWSTGVQEGDSGGRFIAGLDGQSYNPRAGYFGKPSTWANTTNKKGADQRSTTQPRQPKDSTLSLEDNRVLHVLSDTFNSPSTSGYNILRLKYEQATVDTGNVECNLNTGDCKELGSTFSSTTCRGYTIATDSNGHQFISGQWRKPFNSSNYYLPFFCRINESNDALEYLKYVDDDNQFLTGVENSCVHGSHLFIAYRGKGENQSLADNSYRTIINKINISDGSLVWSRAFRTALAAWGPGTERAIGLDCDSDGNVYVLLRSDNSTNFNNQSDPTAAANYVQTALGKINSDGTFGWLNVLGGTIGRYVDNWDEGKGNRLSCDANDGINICLAKDWGSSTGGTANSITIARLPQDGSGTSASAISISGTSATFYYNTSSDVSAVVTYTPTIANVANYSYQNSTTGQTTADNITPNSNWTNPSGHTISTTEL